MPQHHYNRATALLRALCDEQARTIGVQLGVTAQQVPAFAAAVAEAAVALSTDQLPPAAPPPPLRA